jgi:activator of HSP90 ATPase
LPNKYGIDVINIRLRWWSLGLPFANLAFEMVSEVKMNTKNIRQSVTFKVSPHEVYEALMDPVKHAEFTESEVSINRKIGGKFKIYGGEIEGENLELVPDNKIVQTWRYSDWPEGHYSKATFSLKAMSNGTRLTFTQTGVPEEFYEDIRQGWHDYYWNPMKKMLEK